ncbi:MAG: hypothetical protein GY696_06755, partial [Gammaproteobacteria bacterium]|nr:hypothetical protein [Gammaproteobacteria bacterium]
EPDEGMEEDHYNLDPPILPGPDQELLPEEENMDLDMDLEAGGLIRTKISRWTISRQDHRRKGRVRMRRWKGTARIPGARLGQIRGELPFNLTPQPTRSLRALASECQMEL